MVIKKDVDIYGMANALNEKIWEAESNLCGCVKIPHGLAHDLQDFLLYMAEREENKEEIKGTEQNPTSDTKRNACKKPNCFGKYEEEYPCSWSCEDCAYETECYLLHKKKATRKGNKKDE